jgi:hypothetical protein
MSPALLFLVFAGVAFVLWLAIGARWLIWMFVFVTLVIAIDATDPGSANAPILLPLARNQVGG